MNEFGCLATTGASGFDGSTLTSVPPTSSARIRFP
jgi:hypothetical protein